MIYAQFTEVLLILTILLIWFTRKKIRTSKEDAFLFILASSSINAIFDFLIHYFYYLYTPNNILYELGIRIYLMSYILISLSVFVYFEHSLISFRKTRVSKVFIASICLVSFTIELFLPLEVIIESNLIYFEGLAVLYSYIYTFISIVVSVIYAFANIENIQKWNFIGTLTWCVFYALAGFGKFFYHRFELTGFFSTLGILFLYIIIENPENYGDNKRGVLFYDVFYNYITELMNNKSKNSIAYICLKNNIKEDEEIIMNNIYDHIISSFNKNSKSYIFCGNSNELIFVSNDINNINSIVDLYINYIKSSEKYLRIIEHSLSTILVIPDINIIKDANEYRKIFNIINLKNNSYRNNLRIDYYDSLTSYRIKTEAMILKEINTAIDNKNINLQYSLVYDKNGEECGIEISSKILKQNGGILVPNQYIPVAIKYSKIVDIDDMIFEKTSSLIHDIAISDKIKNIFIKTSIIRLEDENYGDKLYSILRRYDIDPRNICLELTNTEAINNKNIVINTMNTINYYGIKVILGGFGRNESNLNYLIDLPVYGIKFHKTIISTSLRNTKSRMILENIIQVAHEIGINVIMTGIINKNTLEITKELGADMMQGDYLSKKMDVNEAKKAMGFFNI